MAAAGGTSRRAVRDRDRLRQRSRRQRRIQIFDGLIASLDGIGPLLQRRVEAGASSQAETGRAQVAADLIRADRERTKTALATARRELAALMGATVPDFGAVTGDLRPSAGRPPLPHCCADSTTIRNSSAGPRSAHRANPSCCRRVSSRFRTCASRWAAGISTRRATTPWSFGLSAQLPLWDQNQGNILSAQETLAKTDAERAVNKSALVVLLGRAYDAMDGAQRELAILRTSAVPKAREAVRALESGYAQGRYTLIELLDTQSAFAQAVLREQEALVAYHTAVATIEWLTGAPLNP